MSFNEGEEIKKAKNKIDGDFLCVCVQCASFQLLVSLLLLTAVSALAVTLGEDYAPNKDPSTADKHPAVYYVNPVIFVVTWVNKATFSHKKIKIEGYVIVCFTGLISFIDPDVVVSGRSEETTGSRRLCYSLRLLVASRSEQHFSVSDPPAEGPQGIK